MTVDDVFFIRGRGTVVTGKVEEGVVRVGDEVRIGGRVPIRVDGIEAFRKVLDQAEPGMNIGLLLCKLDRGDVKAGEVISGEGDGLSSAAEAPALLSDAAVAAPAAEASEEDDKSDARFGQAEAQRAQFLSMRTAGLMSEEQIDTALAALAFSAVGRQWKLTGGSERWLSSSDGVSWKPDSPPGA
jgi:Elongation factor Tu domain 2